MRKRKRHVCSYNASISSDVSPVHVLIKTEVSKYVCWVTQEVDVGGMCERVMDSVSYLKKKKSVLNLLWLGFEVEVETR